MNASDDGSYVILKVTGTITHDRALKYDLEAHAFGAARGISRYLMDLTECRNVDSTTGKYRFAYEDMKSPGIDRRARVALLVNPDDHSHDFIETVCQNAGLDVTLFTDRAAAVRHLRRDSLPDAVRHR